LYKSVCYANSEKGKLGYQTPKRTLIFLPNFMSDNLEEGDEHSAREEDQRQKNAPNPEK